jgi:hypothetical protein
MRVSALFLGSRSMASTGQLSAQGLAPRRFSDKSRSEVAAHFEADKNQISFSANTPTLAWVQGAQDRVSVFIQLGGMLAGNPAGFPVGSTISMYTVGPRDADTWTFLVEAEENWRCPLANSPPSSSRASRGASSTRRWRSGMRPRWATCRCATRSPRPTGTLSTSSSAPWARIEAALLCRTPMRPFCVVLHAVARLYRTLACRIPPGLELGTIVAI